MFKSIFRTLLVCFVSISIMGLSSSTAYSWTLLQELCMGDESGNELWIAKGENDPTAYCQKPGTSCKRTVFKLSGGGANAHVIPPYNQIVLTGTVSEMTAVNTVTNETDNVSPAGYTFTNKFSIKVLDCPENPAYNNYIVNLEGVTIANDGTFTVVLPPL